MKTFLKFIKDEGSGIEKAKSTVEILQEVLGLLRGQYWNYWTTHWQVKGENYYGNHLLFQRLYEAIEEGAALRVRPKLMTVVAIMAGLMPIMWSHGAGSQVMKRIAAPMVGGMVSATILRLIVVPAIYGIWKGWRLPK